MTVLDPTDTLQRPSATGRAAGVREDLALRGSKTNV